MIDRLSKIINTVQENSDIDVVEVVKPEMHLRDDLNFDSLNLAELAVRIEEEFGIDVFQHRIVNTVEQIIETINNEQG